MDSVFDPWRGRRRLYAAAAMEGLLAGCHNEHARPAAGAMPRLAFEYADAMLDYERDVYGPDPLDGAGLSVLTTPKPKEITAGDEPVPVVDPVYAVDGGDLAAQGGAAADAPAAEGSAAGAGDTAVAAGQGGNAGGTEAQA